MKSRGNKHIFGTVKVGEKGQIVIPKEARELYGIKGGDTLLILGDESGMAIVNPKRFAKLMDVLMSPEEAEEE